MSWTLITGASQNLGGQIAISLAEKGHNVLIHYNKSLAKAEIVVETCRNLGVRAELIHGDFSTRTGLLSFTTQLLSKFPDISVLINNIGNYLQKSALQTSLDEWERLFQENLFTPIALVQAVLPSIKKNKGAIINIGTSGISLKADISNTAYMVVKTALLLFTKSIARELADLQVPVNMVSPGQLETSVVVINDLPMGRVAEFKDVTNVILFLLEESSRYLTGQNIDVAGGLGL